MKLIMGINTLCRLKFKNMRIISRKVFFVKMYFTRSIQQIEY